MAHGTSTLQQIGRTPLGRLERVAQGLPVDVLVKCEHMNPGGSIKDRIALAIVDDAESRGALRGGMTLIEATAGNTGMGLALVAAARGYGLVCVTPEKVAGAGTGGTITGVGRHLKRDVPSVRVVLADPIGSGLAQWVETGSVGPDGSYAVEGIGPSEPPANLHRDVIDEAERVSDAESFAMVKRLVREEGLLVGGSAGTNVVAALRLAARGGITGPVVTVLPDSWDRYRAKPWMQEWDT